MSDMLTALKSYRQADQDGVMVIVSRQAVEEAADRIVALEQEVERLQNFRKLFGQYAVEAGEGWRCGEGADLMDAYTALTKEGN